MENTNWENQTSVTTFILLGFGELQTLQIFLFLLFLVIYIGTMAGNTLIVVLVVADHHLHTPMYFFLANLACLETCYTSTILPKLLDSLLSKDRTISVSGCIVQFYFIASLVCSECYLLSLMSYDRYLAVCKPLHYGALMNDTLCIQLAVGSWISGFLAISIVIILMSQLRFCGPNEIDSFVCDFTLLINLSCSDLHVMKIVAFLCSSIFSLVPLVLTMSSYICIIITIVGIPGSTGRQKAFSTCSTHLIVVMLYYGTLIIVYMLPDTAAPRILNKMFSVVYTILTPLVNPLIYSLRNKDVKEAFKKSVRKMVVFTISQAL
ncbi:olfactory receptor 11A1-like [Alligator sinensis]|uniref:Olfactory receptor n=1 Tax=Alligator sinensis TaxID=38654 RepID=A0A1U7SV21_ALLSI|nr:olfactory receptor 11A1-like [Alligator sinensis]